MSFPRITAQVLALFAAFTGSNPDAAAPTVGTLPIAKGGTGGTAAAAAVNNMFPAAKTASAYLMAADSAAAAAPGKITVTGFRDTYMHIATSTDPGVGSASGKGDNVICVVYE